MRYYRKNCHHHHHHIHVTDPPHIVCDCRVSLFSFLARPKTMHTCVNRRVAQEPKKNEDGNISEFHFTYGLGGKRQYDNNMKNTIAKTITSKAKQVCSKHTVRQCHAIGSIN